MLYTAPCANREKRTRKSKSSCGQRLAAPLARAIKALGAISHGRVFEQNTLYDTPPVRLPAARMAPARPIETATDKSASKRFRRVLLTSKAPPPQASAIKKSPATRNELEREVVANPLARLAHRARSPGSPARLPLREIPHQFPPARPPHSTSTKRPSACSSSSKAARRDRSRGPRARMHFRRLHSRHLLGSLRRRLPPSRPQAEEYAVPRKKIAQTRTLRLTNFTSAFTSQFGQKRNAMELSSNSEPGSSASPRRRVLSRLGQRQLPMPRVLGVAGPARVRGNREARPGLR